LAALGLRWPRGRRLVSKEAMADLTHRIVITRVQTRSINPSTH
jgi:hypothetical protein